MIAGDFNENDPDTVGVLDPHLGQPPGLRYRLTQNANASRSQPLTLGVHVPHLQPDHHRVPRSAGPVPGDLEEPWAEKEHQSRIGRRTELPVDRQTQHIPVEMMGSAQVGGAQQDPAAQYLYTAILAAAPDWNAARSAEFWARQPPGFLDRSPKPAGQLVSMVAGPITGTAPPARGAGLFLGVLDLLGVPRRCGALRQDLYLTGWGGLSTCEGELACDAA